MPTFVISNDRSDGTPNVPNANATPKWKSYIWRRSRLAGHSTSMDLFIWDDKLDPADDTFLKWVPIGNYIESTDLSNLQAGSTKVTITNSGGTIYFDVVEANLDINNISGTLPESKLPSNVALTDATNTFTELITFSGGLSGSLAGGATTATKLSSLRDITLTGDAIGTVSGVDWSENVTIDTTVSHQAVGSSNANWNADKLQGKDISVEVPSANDVLAWNALTSQWYPTTVAAAVSTNLSDMADTDVPTTPTNNYFLKWDSSALSGAGAWVPSALLDEVLTDNVLGDLGNVDETGVVAGKYLQYTGTGESAKWAVADAVTTLNDLTDTDLDTPLTGHLLKYDASAGKWVNFALDADFVPEASTNPTNLYYTDERVDDRIGLGTANLLKAGGGIDILYNDSANTLTISGESASYTNLGIASFSSDHFAVTDGAVVLAANGIDDTLIDFGTGTGQVSTSDLPEGSNEYHTTARAQQAITTASNANGAVLQSYDNTDGTFASLDLDTRYFKEDEFLAASAGVGSASKPVKLDAAGHIDATMINDVDIAHNSTSGYSATYHRSIDDDATGATDLWSAQKINSTISAAIQGVDWQEPVLDKDLATPPGSPSTSDRYIVAASGTGAWSGEDGKIAEWSGSAWTFYTPSQGSSTWVEDENVLYVYNEDDVWVKMGSLVDHDTLANTHDWLVNAVDQDGFVSGTAATDDSLVWKTDGNGVPGWRADTDTLYSVAVPTSTTKLTLTPASGAASDIELAGTDPINVVRTSANKLTLSADLATASLVGVAKFNTADFVVSTGDVTLVNLLVSHFDADAITLSGEGIATAGQFDNTHIPTTLAVKSYVETKITDEDLDFNTAKGSTLNTQGAVDLDSSVLVFSGSTAIDITHSDQTVTFAWDGSEVDLGDINNVTEGSLADGHLLVYDNTSGVEKWQNKLVTGDIGIDKAGLTSISTGVIVNADVKSDAAITQAKLDLDDATDAAKGISSFAAADFSVTSGAVSLVDLTVGHLAAAAVIISTDTWDTTADSYTNNIELATTKAIDQRIAALHAEEDTLAEQDDVNLGTLAEGHLLKYDLTSTKWINFAIDTDFVAEGSTNLYYTDTRADARIVAADLGDIGNVTEASPTDAHLLIYDDATDKWENQLLTGDIAITKDGVASITAASIVFGDLHADTVLLSTETWTASDVSVPTVSAVEARINAIHDAEDTLAEQGDVTIASPDDKQILVFDGSAGVDKWKNQTLSGDIVISNTGVATIQADSVALGTDTTGNYVDNVVGKDGIAVAQTAAEGWEPEITADIDTAAGIEFTGSTAGERKIAVNLKATSGLDFDSGALKVDMSDFDTADLAEGTNLYYTDARVKAAVSATGDLDYTTSTGVFDYSHPTQAAISSNNAAGIVLQDIEVNALGHVTSVGTYDLDGRYYTETESDAAFHVKGGGATIDFAAKDLTLAGDLTVAGDLAVNGNDISFDAADSTLSIDAITGENIAGGGLTIKSGAGTGSGTGGSIIFQVANGGSAGTTANTLATALTIADDKLMTVAGVLKLSGVAADANELTALFIDGDSEVVSRELGAAAFTAVPYWTAKDDPATATATTAQIDPAESLEFLGSGPLSTELSGDASAGVLTISAPTFSAASSYVAGWVPAGAAVHGGNFLRKDGTWATPNWTLSDDASSPVTAAVSSGDTVKFQGTANEIEVAAVDGTSSNVHTLTVGLPNDVIIAGTLTVNGTTTTINSTTLTVDDKNIELGSVTTPTDATADGGGITLKGATDKTILWTNSTDSWDFNQNVKITGTLDATSDFAIATNKFTVAASSGNTVVAGTLDATGDFKVNTDKFTVTASSGVTTVAGLLNANGGIAVDADKFTVADGTGDTAVAGTLGVTGITTLAALLNANGGIAVDADKFTVADTTGDTAIAGTLTVDGVTYAKGGVTGSIVSAGDLVLKSTSHGTKGDIELSDFADVIIDGLAADTSEATALFIDANKKVKTRELGSMAFAATTDYDKYVSWEATDGTLSEDIATTEVLKITGTDNEVDVNLTVVAGSTPAFFTVGLPDNVTITGDLTVTGGDITYGSVASTLGVAVETGTNTAGNNLTVNAGAGTGTGTGGSLIFQTAAKGSSGSTANSQATALTIDEDGVATFAGAIKWNAPYTATGDLPSAANNHGMFAHVHGTGLAYYSHASAWQELAKGNDSGQADAYSIQTTNVDDTAPTAAGEVLVYDSGNSKWVVGDHGGIAGLGDDDHTQYALLAGRTSGQHLKGGTAASEDLKLESTSHATKGDVEIVDGSSLLLKGNKLALWDSGASAYDYGINGQVLITDGSGGVSWADDQTGGSTFSCNDLSTCSIDKLSDVDTSTSPGAAINDFLQWDGTNWVPAAGGGTDSNAIHDNVAAEISIIAEKTSLVDDDLLVIEDSESSNAKKRVKISSLPGGSGHTIQDEGNNLTPEANLNFVGELVTATAASSASQVTVDAKTLWLYAA